VGSEAPGRRWRIVARAVAFAGILGVAAGCSSPAPPPGDTFYRIDAPAPEAGSDRATGPSGAVLPGTLEVTPFTAQGIYRERPIVYVAGPASRRQYSYDLWARPPANMIRDTLTRYWAASALAERVIPSDLRQRADYRLRGQIERLEYQPALSASDGGDAPASEADPASTPAMVLEITLSLSSRQASARGNDILVRHRYTRTLALPAEASLEEAAVATGETLAAIAEDFTARAARAVR
jgi:ABC-type uncharacterized transport system auxiliary subunit